MASGSYAALLQGGLDKSNGALIAANGKRLEQGLRLLPEFLGWSSDVV